jgi:hypothetical protein
MGIVLRPYSTIVCGSAGETFGLSLSAPNGGGISTTFTSVNFASYGTPNGGCGSYTYGGCHSSASIPVIQSLALGQTSFFVVANNATFGDPCYLTPKRLFVQLTASGTQEVFIPEPVVTFSVSPTPIIRGNATTLSWNITGNLSSVSINQGIGNVAASGTRSVSPTETTTYIITATGEGGTTTQSATVIVYQPPNTTLSLDSPTIIRGQSTTLNWVTTGDADSASITPGIGVVNTNGNRIVSPIVTTTYTINVSGLGGSDSDSITLIVYQPPTVDITGPASINYGQQGTLTYSATNVDISLGVTPTYNYRGSSVTGAVVNLPIGTTLSGSIATQIPYNDNGPFSVTYVIVATGNGGQESKLSTILINIDETPTNFLVPETEDVLKSQDPVTTPDAVVTSYEILIEDVDIPVEVKADRPILVEINNTDTWIPIREI